MKMSVVSGQWSLGLFALCLASGCVTNDLLENRTVNEMRPKGWERSDRSTDMLEFVRFTKAQQAAALAEANPLAVRMSVAEATWNAHPVLYTLTHIIDYGVLPIGGALATYAGYQAMAGGGNSGDHTKTIIAPNNGSQVIYNNGTGNSGNQAGPSTTSTSTTGL